MQQPIAGGNDYEDYASYAGELAISAYHDGIWLSVSKTSNLPL